MTKVTIVYYGNFKGTAEQLAKGVRLRRRSE
jgi:hypothetical protein